MPKRLNALLALAGLSLVLTGCGGSNTAVTNPDGTEQDAYLSVSVVKINESESVVCVRGNKSISCDWDNKIESP